MEAKVMFSFQDKEGNIISINHAQIHSMRMVGNELTTYVWDVKCMWYGEDKYTLTDQEVSRVRQLLITWDHTA